MKINEIHGKNGSVDYDVEFVERQLEEVMARVNR